MVSYGIPLMFLCYWLEIRAIIGNYFTKISYLLDGQLPHSMMTGELCGIFTLCYFEWYK